MSVRQAYKKRKSSASFRRKIIFQRNCIYGKIRIGSINKIIILHWYAKWGLDYDKKVKARKNKVVGLMNVSFLQVGKLSLVK